METFALVVVSVTTCHTFKAAGWNTAFISSLSVNTRRHKTTEPQNNVTPVRSDVTELSQVTVLSDATHQFDVTQRSEETQWSDVTRRYDITQRSDDTGWSDPRKRSDDTQRSDGTRWSDVTQRYDVTQWYQPHAVQDNITGHKVTGDVRQTSAPLVITSRDPRTGTVGEVLNKAPHITHHLNLTSCDLKNVYVSQDDVLEAVRNIQSSGFHWCFFRIIASEGKFVSSVIETFHVEETPGQGHGVTADVGLDIRAGKNVQRWGDYNEEVFEHTFVVSSTESKMTFSVRTGLNVRKLYLRLRFLVSTKPGTKLLTLVRQTNQTGYITSFAFDGQTRYAHNTSAKYSLSVEAKHVVMISFPHFDLEDDAMCHTDTLWLSEYQTLLMRKWTKCGREDIPPAIHSYPIEIHFVSDATRAGTGFKMFYSIHPARETPKRLGTGHFNCSVPQYARFQLHLRCNLEIECAAGEDERDCNYTSIACGQGFVDAGNKCYRYVAVRRQISWYDAHEQCRSFGQRLVSPRTPDEWQTFRAILDHGKKTFGVYVGLSTSPPSMAAVYGDVWRWTDQTMAFYVNARGHKLAKPTCAYVPPIYTDMLQPIECGKELHMHSLLCEHDKPSTASEAKPPSLELHAINATMLNSNVTTIACPSGHVTRDFLSCDVEALCGASKYLTSCKTLRSNEIAMFVCDSGTQTLHYTLVCDHKQDCADGSDENFCVFAKCLDWQCRNHQCVLEEQRCEGMRHCHDGSDEDCIKFVSNLAPSVPPPAVVDLDGHGAYVVHALTLSKPCPMTHFRCHEGYCLPVYLRCNNVDDCPGREDEAGCDGYTCPGFYHCRASSVCVHVDHLCDGVFQCPQHDDEFLCELKCPVGCDCQGLAFVCNQTFQANKYSGIRYLDASSSGVTPDDLIANFYLVRLSLSASNLATLPNMTFPNLRWLDLSANALSSVNMRAFVGLKNLRVLRLAANPLTSLTNSGLGNVHVNLHTLDLSHTELDTCDAQVLAEFPQVKCLNISHGALSTITAGGLNSTLSLEVLDVRQSPLENFPHDLLRHLSALSAVYASNFKLCCSATLPEDFNLKNCHAPMDEIASCDDLLRSNAYRAFLWVIATMSVVGNVGSFAARVLQQEAAKTGFHVFVTNLSMADLLMGVYLTIVGAADQVYRGIYLWNDKMWKGSAVCQTAGFLSLLSNEVSALFICLITFDRFLVLRFPFSTFHFQRRSALAACAVVWTSGILLAVTPLLSVTSDWEFYSQTGICIPLPIMRRTFRGQGYSFGVMVVFNFVLFVLIAIGQVLVFSSVRKNSIRSNQGNQDATIARRLTTIVMSDFLCWFPIGLLGLLASMGTPIPGEVNVGLVIFILPFNSALNPFLYTFNVFMEKRRKAAEARLLRQLIQRAKQADAQIIG